MAEDKIKIDKEFLDDVLKQITDLKSGIADLKSKIEELEKGQKPTIVSPQIETPDFLLNSSVVYFGGKDLEKEKQFNNELLELMKKYKIIKSVAELIKQF